MMALKETTFQMGLTSEYPLINSTMLRQNLDPNYHMNHSFYALCPSAGPNNLGRYISMILFTLVCIIGLFGNSLVIYVVLRYVDKKKHILFSLIGRRNSIYT